MKYLSRKNLKQSRFNCKFLLFLILVTLFGSCEQSDENGWLTYRHDIKRSGVTSEAIKPPLSLSWSFTPTHPPKTAWMQPSEELPRMHFDNAYHVTISKNRVYFGSSTDFKIYALDLDTGQIAWEFYTNGAVRFAPTIWNNKVYSGSDDGYVYCLNAKNGKLLWKYRPGPSDAKLLGNGNLVSNWPVRTNILVKSGVSTKGIAYFGAGVFPYEGLYICALDAKNGKLIWKNDTIGDLAHELQFGGISPQGYLLASEKSLYVPTGRAMPAAFDLLIGELLYVTNPDKKVGGTWAMLSENELIAGVDRSGTSTKLTYNTETGRLEGDSYVSFEGKDLVLTPKIAYTLTNEGIFAIDREKFIKVQQQIDSLRLAQQKIAGILKDLNRKYYQVKPPDKNALTAELKKTRKQFNQMIADESPLKISACKWVFHQKNLTSLILTEKVLFVGGENTIFGLNIETGATVWENKLEAKAIGLAASNGKLLVSTDQGPIYCFSEVIDQGSATPAPESVKKVLQLGDTQSDPFPKDNLTPVFKKAAASILAQTQINTGYCLVLGSKTGRLAAEISKQSQLKVIGLCDNPVKLLEANKKLSLASLYGAKVVVAPWKLADLPDYFANLIVSESMLLAEKSDAIMNDTPFTELYRVLKPNGGTILLGQPVLKQSSQNKIDLDKIVANFKFQNESQPEIVQKDGEWLKFTRTALAGGGSWTHLYGNSANTGCSDDLLVKMPLGVLWYGEPGPAQMVERHARAAAPIALDGRFFVQGENLIRAYDSYNGTFLWKREIPGAVRVRVDVDGSNLAASEKGLFVAVGDKCHRLDPATGKTKRIYTIPSAPDGSPQRWGFIACNGNLLFGTTVSPLSQQYNEVWDRLVCDDSVCTWKNKEDIPSDLIFEFENRIESKFPVPNEAAKHKFQQDGTKWRGILNFPAWSGGIHGPVPPTDNLIAGDALFALDIETGKIQWIHRGSKIATISISFGDGLIYLTESKISRAQKKMALQETAQLIRQHVWEDIEPAVTPENSDIRNIIALDEATGKKRWEKPLNLTGCGGDAVASAYHDQVLLFFGSFGLHDKWRFPAGQLKWHRVTALSTQTRQILWSRPLNYMVRPLIIDDQVIVEPRACDLYTGKTKTRLHPITGKVVPWEFYRPGHTCAATSATRNGLYYRSYNAAFYDLQKDEGITYFGAIRPGCWINMIPGNGVLHFPEASAGCTCSFPLRTTVVLKSKPAEKTGDWSVFIQHGPMTPVKHLALNLGAPGDKKDPQGTIWFGYPRPTTNYGINLELQEKIENKMGYFHHDLKSAKIQNTDKPWLFRSGCIGLRECVLPLVDEIWGEKSGSYTVRLGFCTNAGAQIGERVFDVKLQDKIVLKDFDIVQAAGAPETVIFKEFNGITVENDLKLSLISKNDNSNGGSAAFRQAPLLNCIEIIREDSTDQPTTSEEQSVENSLKLDQSEIESKLKAAQTALDKQQSKAALKQYHEVFDGTSLNRYLNLALQGMARVGDPTSLNRIAAYCKSPDQILWEYRGPDKTVQNSAIKVLLAIAQNMITSAPHKAERMMKHGLDLAGSLENRQLAITGLEMLGIQVDAETREAGFITHWNFIGPFPWDDAENNLDQLCVDEPTIDLNQSYSANGRQLIWQPYIATQPMVNLVKLIGPDENVAAYAFTEFELAKEQDLLLKIGSNDGFKCWFNGQVIGYFTGGRGWRVDEDVFKVKGKPGINTILLKITQWGGGWGYSVRLVKVP